MKTKPTLEKLSPEFGNSIVVKQHSEIPENYKPFWHFHPEIELLYVNKGSGKRHIGNHISYFNNSQLLLIGSNLPHNGFTNGMTRYGKETIVQFHPDFLGDDFFKVPEMKAINQLLDRAKKGILFNRETKIKVGPKINKLSKYEGFERIIKVIKVLHELALAEDYRILNPEGFNFETEPQDTAKIDIIFKHVNNNFTNHISLEEIADKTSMTVPAFCRYLKRVTGKTFTKLVNEYRVVHATKLLQESNSSITDICYECGFNNFSHFNKIFKEVTGKSASKYRSEMKQMVQ